MFSQPGEPQKDIPFSGICDEESCQELLIIEDDMGPGTMGNPSWLVGGSINISWGDWFQEGDHGDLVLFNKGLVHEEPFGSTIQEDLGFNDLFSICILVSERQREMHGLGFYISYKYRGDI